MRRGTVIKSVLLVDDNKKILDLMVSIMPWEEKGFKLIGTAGDGKEAINIAKENHIDILVTDIKMPVMDGIELISSFSPLYPYAKIMVLSSYNEFSLVREAFKHGASEYLLKTELDEENFIKILEQFADRIDEENAVKALAKEGGPGNEDLKIKRSESVKELYESRIDIKNRLLYQLVRGYIKEEALLQKDLAMLECRFFKGCYRVMCLCVDNFNILLDNVWNGDERLLSFAISNILQELLAKGFIADCFYSVSSEFNVIFYAKELSELSDISIFNSFFESAKDALLKYMKVRISGGISNDDSCGMSLPALYQSAYQASQTRFIYGHGKLLSIKDGEYNSGKIAVNSYERVDYLKSALKSVNPQTLKETLEIVCLKSSEVNLKEFSDVTRLYEKYSIILHEFAEANGMMALLGEFFTKFDESSYDTWSLEQLNQWLRGLLEAIWGQFYHFNDAVRSVIKYVEKNYQKDVSLQSVADNIGINRSHLSRLIKKELGTTFPEYLNNFRIDKAKELIENSRYKLYEISEMVGYSNFEHFSRMFKKVAGKSASEWKRS